MNIDTVLESTFLASPGKFFDPYDLLAKYGADKSLLQGALGRLRQRYGSFLKRRFRTYALICTEAAKDQPARDAIFTAPIDLWRGWLNPETGRTATSLGLGYTPFAPRDYFLVEKK